MPRSDTPIPIDVRIDVDPNQWIERRQKSHQGSPAVVTFIVAGQTYSNPSDERAFKISIHDQLTYRGSRISEMPEMRDIAVQCLNWHGSQNIHHGGE